MLKVIYISLIIIITIWTLYLYLESDQEYQKELRRISMLEGRHKKQKDIINYNRLNSLPCNITNLNNPRECYNGSNYECKWIEQANRCNQLD